ncbi:MAG: GTPase/DUF3482 domain-containing protein [Planctomycetota bacterium]|jgi:hypothetical protein
MSDPVRVAVVGHTNTGKTSLLRTLTRDVGFGQVSDRPAVTRHVEGAALLVDGRAAMELYDTPGMEDSIALLEHLDEAGQGARRSDWIDVITSFLETPAARDRYAQESKVLRQILAADVALYVVDARDPVVGKHLDELEILRRCARPVVPILNFTASDEAQTATWTEQMSRLGLHAIARFDTVVLDDDGERRLFETIGTLLDAHRATIDRLIADRARMRGRLRDAACQLIADALVDAAAHVVRVEGAPGNDADPTTVAAVDDLKALVRHREQQCVDQLLDLFRFRPGDGHVGDIPLDDGRWGLDLFSPEAVKQFGVRTTGAVAAGAMAGLAVDAMFAGVSLGAGLATGAAIGALMQAGHSFGRRLLDRARGHHELRVADSTLLVLQARQVELLQALERRGHAAMDPVAIDGAGSKPPKRLAAPLRKARLHPEWSRLQGDGADIASDARMAVVRAMSEALCT